MIKKKISLIALAALTTLLIGCTAMPTKEVTLQLLASSSEDQFQLVTTVSPSITTRTLSLTRTSQLTATNELPTIPTSTNTVTPPPTAIPTTSAPSVKFSSICSENEPDLLGEDGLTGALAYVALENASWQQTEDQTGIIGGTPLQSQIFPPLRDIEVIGFSPNENWFAFAKLTLNSEARLESVIYLISPDGQTVESPISVLTDRTIYWFGAWISNELIMIQTLRFPETGFGSYTLVSFAIYDAFTGEKRQDIFNSLPDHHQGQRVCFSPDMTRAVYFSDPNSSLGESIVLWDMEKQTILWKETFRSAFGLEQRELGYSGMSQTAFWAPDSSAFVFTTFNPDAGDEFKYRSTLVNRDGTSEKTLIRSSNFEDTMALGGLWSPNGRFIYYFFPEKSFIYDLVTNEVIQLCSFFSTDFAWSPNGESIAYRQRIDDEDYLVIYDILSGESKSIGKIRSISGLQWIANEEWLTPAK